MGNVEVAYSAFCRIDAGAASVAGDKAFGRVDGCDLLFLALKNDGWQLELSVDGEVSFSTSGEGLVSERGILDVIQVWTQEPAAGPEFSDVVPAEDVWYRSW